MSWSVPDLMSIRLEFVAEALGRRHPFAGLCTLYGISEKTGYKWVARFRAGGPAGLSDSLCMSGDYCAAGTRSPNCRVMCCMAMVQSLGAPRRRAALRSAR